MDIETLPTNSPSVIEDFAKTIKAPGQYKKPESIEEWMKENKETELKELVAKTSFDGLYGQIACIAWTFDDGEIMSTHKDDSEADCIDRFYRDVSAHQSTIYHGGSVQKDLTICGHNIAGFDLPFLKHRSIILNVCPPPQIRKAMNAKTWDSCIADTMLMWSPDREKRASMDKLCKAFGIKGKEGFDGSMVAATWPVDPQKVIDYCKDDVERVRAIHRRMTFAEAAEAMTGDDYPNASEATDR